MQEILVGSFAIPDFTTIGEAYFHFIDEAKTHFKKHKMRTME